MEFRITEPQRLRWFLRDLPREHEMVIVIPTGDVHFGNPQFSLKHFSRHMAYIADTPNAYTILTGDLLESDLRTSKGDIYKQVGSPQNQRDWIIEQLLPIKDKILGCTSGNHEDRIYDQVGVDLSKDIAEALGVPYRNEGILLKLQFGNLSERHEGRKWAYTCYATHGYGGARTSGGKAVKIERTSTYVHADFYLMSHDHVVNAANAVYLMPESQAYWNKDSGFMTGSVTAHVKKLVKTNAFLMWGGYAERGGFPPTSLETPFVKLAGTGDQKSVRIES